MKQGRIQVTTLEALSTKYQITKTDSDRIPYILKGKRGSTLTVYRQANADGTAAMNRPMFAVNNKTAKTIWIAK